MRRILLSILCLSGTLAHAEIYRWTDDQGRVHFGERPPAGAERVDVRPQVVERDPATREREQRSERFFQARREEREQEQQRLAQSQAERDEQCRALRLQLQRLEHGGTFFRTDASGERHYYSDAEVEAARRELRNRTREMCD